MNQQPTSLPRRHLLAGSGAALAAVGLASFGRTAAAAGETAPVALAPAMPVDAGAGTSAGADANADAEAGAMPAARAADAAASVRMREVVMRSP
jgi:hypothetical protein